MGAIMNFVSKLRKVGEDLFPDLVPVLHRGKVVHTQTLRTSEI